MDYPGIPYSDPDDVSEIGEPDDILEAIGDTKTPRIDGDRLASALLRDVRRIDAEVARLGEMAAAERAYIDEWLSGTADPLIEKRKRLTDTLERYHRALVAQLGKDAPRTIRLPAGELKARRKIVKLDVTEASAFCKWAAHYGLSDDLVRPPKPGEPAPELNEVKKLIMGPDGKMPTGRVHFYIDGDPPQLYADVNDGTDHVIVGGELVPGIVPEPAHDEFDQVVYEKEGPSDDASND